jgi:hypothetical protein
MCIWTADWRKERRFFMMIRFSLNFLLLLAAGDARDDGDENVV